MPSLSMARVEAASTSRSAGTDATPYRNPHASSASPRRRVDARHPRRTRSTDSGESRILA
jgi:hypothetical protein